MTEYSLIEDGISNTGTKTFTVKIDGAAVATQRTKVDAMMELWARLDPNTPADLWDEMKQKFHDRLES